MTTTEPHRILITGGGGYLGHRLLPLAENAGAVLSPRSSGLDITDRDAVFRAVESLRPTAIIHAAAANPGVDETAMAAINSTGTANVAQAAEAAGARLVCVSTDIVHAGDTAPYADDASPSPTSTYGRTKAEGEMAALDACPGAAIARTSLIWGLERIDRGTEGFAERLATGADLNLFGDVIRQPVWVDDLATALIALAVEHTDVSGTLNVAGSEVVTRLDFGRLLLDWWRVPGRERVTEASAATISSSIPLDLRLSLDRAESLGMSVRGVRDVLAEHPRVPPQGE